LVLDGHTAEEVTKTELDIVFHAVSGVLSIPNPAEDQPMGTVGGANSGKYCNDCSHLSSMSRYPRGLG
jgi:hypothetical protein